MASVDASEIPEEQQFMIDFWNYRKKYYHPEDSKEYWDSVIKDGNSLGEKYNNLYFNNLIICCVDEWERQFRLARGQETKFGTLEALYERLRKQKWS